MKNAILYLFLFLAFQAVATFAVQGAWHLATGSDAVTAPVLVTIMLVFSLLTVAVFLLARWTVVSVAYFRTRPWMTFFWVVMATLGFIIPSSWLQEQLPELPNLVEGQFEMMLGNYWGYVVIGLLAPLAEEVVFRGAMLRSLLSSSLLAGRPWLAIALSALLFAVGHLNPAQMPHAFIVGLFLGWMYWRTGSILPCVLCHWVNNSVAYILYHAYPDPNIQLIDIFRGSQLHVLLALLFSLLILVPSLLQLHVWMRRVGE